MDDPFQTFLDTILAPPQFQASDKFPHSNFCIFASEIGALIGENAFKSSEESMDRIIHRHNPDFTSLEFKRKQLITQEQETKERVKLTSHEMIDAWTQKTTKNAQQRKTHLKPLHASCKKLTTSITSTLQTELKVSPLLAKKIVPLLTRRDSPQAVKEMKRHLADVTEPLSTLATLQTKCNNMLDEIKDSLQVTSETAQKVYETLSAKETTESALLTLKEHVPEMALDTCEVKQLARIEHGRLDCARGVQGEKDVVQKLNIQDNNAKQFKRVLVESPIPIVFLGYVDGMTQTGLPIEIKHRRKHLNGQRCRIWPHERAQIHVYMYLTKTTSLQFIEAHESMTRETIVKFDSMYWNSLVRKCQDKVMEMWKRLNA